MIIFTTHLAVTLLFTGAIWYAQIDQYPLLKFIGRKELPSYQKEYYRRTMPVAVSLLILELVTGILLVWHLPSGIPYWIVWVNLTLIAIVWILTWGGCVRCHIGIKCGLEDNIFHKLLRINGARCYLWSARSIILLSALAWL